MHFLVEVAASPQAGCILCDFHAWRKEASQQKHDAKPPPSEGFCLGQGRGCPVAGTRLRLELQSLTESSWGQGPGVLCSGRRKMVLPAKRQTASKQLVLHVSKCGNLTTLLSAACLRTDRRALVPGLGTRCSAARLGEGQRLGCCAQALSRPSSFQHACKRSNTATVTYRLSPRCWKTSEISVKKKIFKTEQQLEQYIVAIAVASIHT